MLVFVDVEDVSTKMSMVAGLFRGSEHTLGWDIFHSAAAWD